MRTVGGEDAGGWARAGVACAAVIALAGGCVSSRPATKASKAPPAPERRLRFRDGASMLQAQNGLRVLLLPQEATNLVHVALRVAVGSADERDGEEGLAHLAEHLSFEIRPTGAGGPTLEEDLARETLSYNAHTSSDATHFESTALAASLETLIQIELTRLDTSCDHLHEADFNREREVVRNELRERYGGAGELGRLLREEAYPEAHPYRRSVAGDGLRLSSLSREDACDFFDRHYVAPRALLVISGDFELKAVRAFLNRHLPRVRAADPKPRVRAPPPSYNDQDELVHRRLPIQRPLAIALVPLPPRAAKEHLAASFLVQVVHSMISTASSRDDRILDGAAVILGGGRAPVLAVTVEVASEDELDVGREVIEGALEAARGRFGGAVVRALRQRHRIDLLFRAERPVSRAALYADYWQFGGRLDFVVGDLEKLEEVRAPTLQVLAGRLFARPKLLLVIPDEAAREPGSSARLLYPWTTEGEARSVPVDPAAAERPLELGAASAAGLRPRKLVLENGLEVWLQPTRGLPLVDVRLLLRGGRADEPPLKAGLAELAVRRLEHPQRSARLALAALETGGSPRFAVSPDMSTLRIRGLAGFFDHYVAALASLAVDGVYASETWERDRKRLIGALAEESAQHRAAEALRAGVFGPEHPYGQIGEMSSGSVALIELGDLERFRRRHHRPDRAVLIVSGRFDPDLAEEHVRFQFSRWSAEGAAPPTSRAAASERDGPVRRVISREPGTQAELRLGFRTAPGTSGDYAARLVLEKVLDGRAARIREGLAASYGVDGRHRTLAGPGMLVVEGAVDPLRLGEVISAMEEELDALRRGDALAADLVLARRAVVESLLADRGDTSSAASRIEFLAAHRLEPDFYDRLIRDVARVDLKRLQAAMDITLARDREAWVLVGDPGSVEPATRKEKGRDEK